LVMMSDISGTVPYGARHRVYRARAAVGSRARQGSDHAPPAAYRPRSVGIKVVGFLQAIHARITHDSVRCRHWHQPSLEDSFSRSDAWRLTGHHATAAKIKQMGWTAPRGIFWWI